MKTRHLHLHACALSVFASVAAQASRDPFWPIGYTPPPPPSATNDVPAEPVVIAPPPPPKPAAPAEKPVTTTDWASARKALAISGFTKSVKPDTKETRVLVMINRRSYTTGDTVTFVNDGIRFQWRVDTITENDLSLTPLAATRVQAKPADLNSKQ